MNGMILVLKTQQTFIRIWM